MEILIHVILLLGGVLLWTGLLLIVISFVFAFTVAGMETITGSHYDVSTTPWVRRFRYITVIVWVTIALVTSLYYGMQVDIQLNPLVWQKGFYTEVIDDG